MTMPELIFMISSFCGHNVMELNKEAKNFGQLCTRINLIDWLPCNSAIRAGGGVMIILAKGSAIDRVSSFAFSSCEFFIIYGNLII